MRLLKIAAFLCIIGLFACSTTKNAHRQNYARDVITIEEIKATAAGNAYDLIKNLRPHWLRGRGRKSLYFEGVSYPVVYVNESRHGSIDSLASIATEQITEIRFLNSGEAAQKFGLNHVSGAILITI